MTRIFISYRREDTKWPAGRLYDAIRRYTGASADDVFIDVDNIPFGVDFVDHLDSKVAQCDILLALIGPDWLRNPRTGQRRLDDPKDFVRVEIASALRRDIRVVPVLIDNAPFPAASELPEELHELTRRNGVEIRLPSFDADVERMLKGLGLAKQTAPPVAAARVRWPRLAIGGVLATAVGAAALVLLWPKAPRGNEGAASQPAAASLAGAANIDGPAGAAAQSITLYQQAGYVGPSRTFTQSMPNLWDTGFADSAVSARIIGAWRICQHANYTGHCSVINHDETNLGRYGLGAQASSLEALPMAGAASITSPTVPEGAKAILYTDTDFKGRSLIVTSVSTDLATANFSDLARSMRVEKGAWEICEHAHFNGICATIEKDVADLASVNLSGRASAITPVPRQGK